MARYLITFSYDGSKFNGYQKQPNLRTVQGELEEKLTILNSNRKVLVSASGRTDAGVHAYGQTAHFDLAVSFTPVKLKLALNSLLDGYIYIKSIYEVDNSFHARFNVKKKEYIYKINVGDYNLFEKDYVYQYNKRLDIVRMKKAIKYFIGTHNFKSFTKANVGTNDFVRTIYSAKIKKDADMIIISFIGNGFMRYMVRNMVGFLIEIGEGKKAPSDVNKVLSAEDRRLAGKTANPEGLYLSKVYY